MGAAAQEFFVVRDHACPAMPDYLDLRGTIIALILVFDGIGLGTILCSEKQIRGSEHVWRAR